MADDDEPMILNETRSYSRRQHSKKRKRRSKKANIVRKVDPVLDTPTAQPDIWIIDDPQPPETDTSDLIVIDSVESDEVDENNSKDAKDTNGHFNHTDVLLSPEARVEELLDRIRLLENENHFLKYGGHKPEGSFSISSAAGGPPIQVTFFSAQLAEKYRKEAEEFLKDLCSREPCLSSEKQSTSEYGEFVEKSDPEKFVVDKDSQEENLPSSQSWAIPVYNHDYEEVMRVPTGSTEEEPTAKLSLPVEHCFNCMGIHLIKDCPEKHNPQKIAQNKRKVYGSRAATNKSRMGNEKLWQLKYKPGRISESLRKALSLKPIQMPPYVYTMRVLGYPPGWLKEAEIDKSEINIYDSDGKVVSNRNCAEDGEIDCREIRVQYDLTKIVDYPGFNVPVPSSCIDEHLKFGLPPMQHHQQRAEAEKFMTVPAESLPYRKRKLELSTSSKKKPRVTQRDEQDMEVEDISDVKIQSSDEGIEDEFGSPSPKAVVIDDDSTDQSQDTLPSSQDSSRVSSPTLTDLEERKLKLMNDLEAASSIIEEENDSQKAVTGSLDEVEMTLVSTPTRSARGASDLSFSKSVEPGTPVLLVHSPFTKLPEPKDFASGISDHINYENLPNATGCFDKLRNVLTTVRRQRDVSLD